jgi:hypothetical protein
MGIHYAWQIPYPSLAPHLCVVCSHFSNKIKQQNQLENSVFFTLRLPDHLAGFSLTPELHTRSSSAEEVKTRVNL